MRRARAIAGIAALALALELASSAMAGPKPAEGGDMPAWLREARARPADPHAPWTLLHDETIVEPLAEGGVRITERIAARASSLRLLDGFRSFDVVHGPDDEVLFARGWTIQPDGTILMPDAKDDVSEIPWIRSAYIEYVRARHVVLPDVLPGSIVAWEHQVKHGLDKGAVPILLGHGSAPTRLARAELRVPAGWSFAVNARGASFAESRSETNIALELTDLAPPRPDPLPAAISETRPLVWLRWFSPDGTRGFRDWDGVGRWSWKLAQEPAARLGGAEPLSRELAPAATPGAARPPGALRAAIERAFRFASSDVRYVGIEIGIGGYRPASPEESCRDRLGDCKAKAILLRALLQPWGLKCWPVLVRTRDLGAVDPEVPTPAQFNHYILALEVPTELTEGDIAGWAVVDVPGIGRVAFLDATVEGLPSAPLRADDQGTLALLMHESGSRLVRLPEQAPELGGKRVELDVSLDDTGRVVTGSLKTTWTGDEAGSMRRWLLTSTVAARTASAAERVQDIAPGATLEGHALTGLDDVSASVVETATLRGGRLAQRAMDLLIVLPGSAAPALLSEMPAPPPRPWPLDVGEPRTLEAVVRVQPPPGWRPEQLPAPWEIATAHLAARTSWEQADDGSLTWRRSVKVLRAIVPPEEHADFHRDVAALRAHDSEGLTLVSSTR